MEHTENIAINQLSQHAGIFTPEDVVKSFNAEFLDSEFCRCWVVEKLHKEAGSKCPECGAVITDNLVRSFWENKRIECYKCGKWFTAMTGTFLSGCHMNFREIVLFALLIGLGIPDKEIARIMAISQESVRLWRLKFNGQKK